MTGGELLSAANCNINAAARKDGDFRRIRAVSNGFNFGKACLKYNDARWMVS
jgi:hypothetical protein